MTLLVWWHLFFPKNLEFDPGIELPSSLLKSGQTAVFRCFVSRIKIQLQVFCTNFWNGYSPNHSELSYHYLIIVLTAVVRRLTFTSVTFPIFFSAREVTELFQPSYARTRHCFICLHFLFFLPSCFILFYCISVS